MKTLCGLLAAMLVLMPSVPTHPTEAEILAEYTSARQAYSWFFICTAPTDARDCVEIDRMPYHRLRDFSTWDEYMAYLGEFLDETLIEAWLSAHDIPLYLEIEGKAYAVDAARGTDIGKGAESYSIVRESNTKYILYVTVELLDYSIIGNMNPTGEVIGYEVYEFPYEYVDGNWVFTDFPAID